MNTAGRHRAHYISCVQQQREKFFTPDWSLITCLSWQPEKRESMRKWQREKEKSASSWKKKWLTEQCFLLHFCWRHVTGVTNGWEIGVGLKYLANQWKVRECWGNLFGNNQYCRKIQGRALMSHRWLINWSDNIREILSSTSAMAQWPACIFLSLSLFNQAILFFKH